MNIEKLLLLALEEAEKIENHADKARLYLDIASAMTVNGIPELSVNGKKASVPEAKNEPEAEIKTEPSTVSSIANKISLKMVENKKTSETKKSTPVIDSDMPKEKEALVPKPDDTATDPEPETITKVEENAAPVQAPASNGSFSSWEDEGALEYFATEINEVNGYVEELGIETIEKIIKDVTDGLCQTVEDISPDNIRGFLSAFKQNSLSAKQTA